MTTKLLTHKQPRQIILTSFSSFSDRIPSPYCSPIPKVFGELVACQPPHRRDGEVELVALELLEDHEQGDIAQARRETRHLTSRFAPYNSPRNYLTDPIRSPRPLSFYSS